VLKVRLYRPFSIERASRGPAQDRQESIAVLDRTKEPGATGEPLYKDVSPRWARRRRRDHRRRDAAVIGGRYGLSSKEFTPAMVKAVFDELARTSPRTTSPSASRRRDAPQPRLDATFDDRARRRGPGVFFGLGADGTVGANKNSIKIIGEDTDNYAQGYFVYDSKKSGAMTVSHLRFGPKPDPLDLPDQQGELRRLPPVQLPREVDVLEKAKPGATFLLNSPYGPTRSGTQAAPRGAAADHRQEAEVLRRSTPTGRQGAGMGAHQHDHADLLLRHLRRPARGRGDRRRSRTRSRRPTGARARRSSRRTSPRSTRPLANLHEVKVPGRRPAHRDAPARRPDEAPGLRQEGHRDDDRRQGRLLPVSALPVDGTFPTGTTASGRSAASPSRSPSGIRTSASSAASARWSARTPRSAEGLRPEHLEAPPSDLQVSVDYKGKDFPKLLHDPGRPRGLHRLRRLRRGLPGQEQGQPKRKAINMAPAADARAGARTTTSSSTCPSSTAPALKSATVKGSSCSEPLFEFSGACAGCGETPYVKLISASSSATA
jgi:pyruvate-ferredoxin/flavodoxin oxidoreductase